MHSISQITNLNTLGQYVKSASKGNWEKTILKDLWRVWRDEAKPKHKETKMKEPKFLPAGKDYIDPHELCDPIVLRNGVLKAVWDALTDFEIKYTAKVDYLCKVSFLSYQQVEKIVTNNFNK
tara:strand:- start:1416 stop:1781 length:366 start_codon:yes stop_codon:yes gene_type:complete